MLTLDRLRLLFVLVVSLFLLIGCGQLDLPFGPLLYDVSLQPTQISPNADGDTDATEIKYSLRSSALLDIYFENSAGERFYFRQGQRRSPDLYSVYWGGVIDEPRILDEGVGVQQILSQVLPDGVYRWTISATDDRGATESVSGEITLQNADAVPPQLQNFAVVPPVFRPNQDGLLDDGITISYYLTKDVDTISVYLTKPDDPAFHYDIAEQPGVVTPTVRGAHGFRYEGGVDLGADPPADGDYLIVAMARDLAGNAVQVTQTLRIEEGGKPRADVVSAEVDWYTILPDGVTRQDEYNRQLAVSPGGNLCFTSTVVNEGAVPIRTEGPWSGQMYKLSENRNLLAQRHAAETGNAAWFQQTGVFRFGLNFETTGVDFPFRWAIGGQEGLSSRLIDGHEQWYLLPGKRATVAGCILFDEEGVNQALPLTDTIWWAGLIHEYVGVPNNNIDRITVRVER